MHADGQFDCAIAPAKEGTVQDVQWGPAGSNKGNKFVVIAGSMPSTSTLYNIKVRSCGGVVWYGVLFCCVGVVCFDVAIWKIACCLYVAGGGCTFLQTDR